MVMVHFSISHLAQGRGKSIMCGRGLNPNPNPRQGDLGLSTYHSEGHHSKGRVGVTDRVCKGQGDKFSSAFLKGSPLEWRTRISLGDGSPPNAEQYICIINFNGNGDMGNGKMGSHGVLTQ